MWSFKAKLELSVGKVFPGALSILLEGKASIRALVSQQSALCQETTNAQSRVPPKTRQYGNLAAAVAAGKRLLTF